MSKNSINKKKVRKVARLAVNKLFDVVLYILVFTIIFIGWLIKKLIRPISTNDAYAVVIYVAVYSGYILITGDYAKTITLIYAAYISLRFIFGENVQCIMNKLYKACVNA